MKTLLKQSLGLTSLLGWISISQAQYSWSPPPIIFLPPSGPSTSCATGYVGFSSITNPVTGSIWFSNKFSGYVTAEVTGFSDVRIEAIRRRDLAQWCSTSNTLTLWSESTNAWKFIVYAMSEPPTNAVIQFFYHDPVIAPPTLELTWLDGPATNGTGAYFWIKGMSPNVPLYQFFYSQVLLPLNSPDWIPHEAYYGYTVSNYVRVQAHNTFNRPDGFWMLKAITWSEYQYNTNIFDDPSFDLTDPPIGYPEVSSCTNCSGDPTPPMP